jgi:hypothetical protein
MWNHCVTHGSSFDDDFIVRRGCLGCRIHSSPVEAVSLMYSGSAATQFSNMIFDPKRAVGAVESMRHLWKQFC